jgi:hypothetical protein
MKFCFTVPTISTGQIFNTLARKSWIRTTAATYLATSCDTRYRSSAPCGFSTLLRVAKILAHVFESVRALIGIAFAGFLAGAVTIFLFHVLAPSLPVEAITPPAHNIADWRSLVVIAIGCLAILCFFLIRSLVSRPLGELIENSFAKWDAVVARRPNG